jgi:hypothetical protein
MPTTTPDGLFLFGTAQTAEVPSTPGDANHATPKSPLGSLYRENGKVWRYVQFDNGSGNVAAAAYGVVHWKTLVPASGSFVVTSEYSSGIGKNLVAGVIHSVVTDQYYTWIQVGGISTAQMLFTTLTGDPVAAAVAGCKCYYSSTDLKFNLIEAATSPQAVVFGVLTAAGNKTAGTGSVLLQNLDW